MDTDASRKQCNQLLYGSLFSGIGGMDLGFDRAGMKCVWQVEIDPYARRVLEKHWPEVPKHDDIRTFTNIPYVDVVAGGFPCQDISYAGKGAGLAGERSGLFYEAMRVVREVGPRFVVLENVSALLTRGLDDVLGTLASLGYDAEWHCVQAAAVGAPHLRDRLFVLAHDDSYDCEPSRSSEVEGWTAGLSFDASKQDSTLSNVANPKSGRRKTRSGLRRNSKPPRRWQPVGGGEIARLRIHWESEPAVGRVANGVPSRVDRLRGLGNAVVPQVAELIARRIVQSI